MMISGAGACKKHQPSGDDIKKSNNAGFGFVTFFIVRAKYYY